MDIVISGSSGLIGSALVADLLADGHRVARLLRPESTRPGDGSDRIDWDPDRGVIDSAALDGSTALVHLSGESIGARRWNEAQKQRILASRTVTTELLADTLAELNRPPTVWLSGSGVGFYGETGAEVVDETAGPGDDFLAGVCRQWEDAAQAPDGTRRCLLRTGVVLSRDGGALAEQLPFFRFGLGGRLGSGEQYWSWISLADQVAAIRFLLTTDVAGPVNLCAPHPVTNREFTRSLGAAVHRPTLLPTPRFAVNARLGRELADALLFTSTRVRPTALLDAGFSFAHPTLGRALADLFERTAS